MEDAMSELRDPLPPPSLYELGQDRLQIIERIYRPSTKPGAQPILDYVIEGKVEAF